MLVVCFISSSKNQFWMTNFEFGSQWHYLFRFDVFCRVARLHWQFVFQIFDILGYFLTLDLASLKCPQWSDTWLDKNSESAAHLMMRPSCEALPTSVKKKLESGTIPWRRFSCSESVTKAVRKWLPVAMLTSEVSSREFSSYRLEPLSCGYSILHTILISTQD